MERFLPSSPTVRLVIRMALAATCFAVAAILSVIPGPAVVFWLAGFVLLGFSAGQILLSLHAVAHRRSELASKDVRIGDTVLLERAGDVIPYVVRVLAERRSGRERRFRRPATCPVCA